MNTRGLRKIGKGAFSTVYKKSRNKVLIRSRDKAKMALADGFLPNSFLFPKLTMVGVGNDGYHFYESKYYPRVSSLKNNLSPYDYEFYKELQDNRVWDDVWSIVENMSPKYHRRRVIIEEAIGWLLNYGQDLSFEISPRNVAVDKGRLVMLDCFYYIEDLY